MMSQDVSNMQSEKRSESVAVVATHLYDSIRTQRKLVRRGALTSLLQKVCVIFLRAVFSSEFMIRYCFDTIK